MATKAQFELVDHCCRVCGGRLLQRRLDSGHVQIRCAECAAVAEVAPTARSPHAALCFCGVTLASGADAGLRCRRSERRSPERPQEVVVLQEAQEPVKKRSTPRPIRTGVDSD